MRLRFSRDSPVGRTRCLEVQRAFGTMRNTELALSVCLDGPHHVLIRHSHPENQERKDGATLGIYPARHRGKHG